MIAWFLRNILRFPPVMANAIEISIWVVISNAFILLVDTVKLCAGILVLIEKSLRSLEEQTGLERLELFWISCCIPLAIVTGWALMDAANTLLKISYGILEKGRQIYLNLFGFSVREITDVKHLSTARGTLIDVDKLMKEKVMLLVSKEAGLNQTPIAGEGPYGRGYVYEKRDGIPKGVFQLWGRPAGTKDLVWLGHGGACLGKGYCTFHQVHTKEGARNCEKYFIGTPKHDKVLPVELGQSGLDYNGVNYGLDVQEILPGGAFATLGIKSLKPGVYQPGKGVTYHHYDILTKSYYAEYATDKGEGLVDEEGRPGHPMAIHTETNTSPGDSGMPVVQNDDEFVFIHQGDVPAFKLNAALPPLPFLLDVYRTVWSKQEDKEVKIIQTEVSTPVTVESPSVSSSLTTPPQFGANSYAKKASEWTKAAEEKKKERMLGEHEDSQGYGRGKKSEGSYRPELAGYASAQDFKEIILSKGKSWADVRDEAAMPLSQANVETEQLRKEYAEKFNMLDSKLDRLLKFMAAEPEPSPATKRDLPVKGVLNSSGQVGGPQPQALVAFESPAQIREQLGMPQQKAKPPQIPRRPIVQKTQPQAETPSAQMVSSSSMVNPVKSTPKSKAESLISQLESLKEEDRTAVVSWVIAQSKSPNPPKEAQTSSSSSQPKGPSKSSMRRLKQKEKLEKKLLKDLQNSTPPQKVEQSSETVSSTTSSEPPKQE